MEEQNVAGFSNHAPATLQRLKETQQRPDLIIKGGPKAYQLQQMNITWKIRHRIIRQPA
jgi:hypothetical protein